MEQFCDEFLDSLLARDMGRLSTEEEAWIQRYLDLADKVLEPKLRLIIEKYKQQRPGL